MDVLPYGEGIFRRAFLLRSTSGRVVADMEDDFHRFRVRLSHDGTRVTGVEADAFRYPWSACPGATLPLRALEGMRLSLRPSATGAQTNPRSNCTHLFDLATLAVGHAAAGRESRRYDIAVPDRVKARTRVSLVRDAEPLLDWEVHGTQIVAPQRFAGDMRRAGFIEWAEANLPADEAEAVLTLRRGCFIAMGRARDLDEAPNAAHYMTLAGGSCYSFTPGIAEGAERVKGTAHEFTHSPERLLADLNASP